MVSEFAKIEYGHLPKRPGVYRVINVITDDSYIGSSHNVWHRCRGHSSALFHGNGHPRLRKSYRDHGVEAFRIELLEECSKEDLLSREYAWIEKLRPTMNTVRVKPEPRGDKKLVVKLMLTKEEWDQLSEVSEEEGRSRTKMAVVLFRKSLADAVARLARRA